MLRADESGRCANRRDDDGDGLYDCDDPGCADAPACVCVTRPVGSAVGPDAFGGDLSAAGHRASPSCAARALPDEVVVWTAPRAGRFTFAARGATLARIDGCDGAELACGEAIGVDVEAGEGVTLVVDDRLPPGGSWAVSVWVDDEAGRCADGVDDDGDGAVDCADTDCADAPACRPAACPDGDRACVAALCRGPGGCAEPACATHPVCRADHDLGRAVGVDLWVGVGEVDRFASPCGGWLADDVSFAWTAPSEGLWQVVARGVDAAGAGPLDPTLSLRRHPSNDTVCSSDAIGEASTSRLARVALERGETVTVVVDGDHPGGRGGFALSVLPDRPRGDGTVEVGRWCEAEHGHDWRPCDFQAFDCDAVCGCLLDDIGAVVGPAVFEGSTAGRASRSAACGGAGPDASVVWTAPGDGRWRFAVRGLERPVVGMRAGCSVEPFACAEADGDAAALEADVAAGGDVIVVIDSAGEGGPFTLDVTPVE